MPLFGRRRNQSEGWQMTDGAGAPASPLAGNWTHSDAPAMAAVHGNLFPGTGSPMDDPDQGLAEIRARDPRFDRDVFLEQVQRTFFLVEEAWTQRNPDMSRQVMADGLWQQHRFQIESYRSGGKRNVLDGLAVLSVTFVAVHLDTNYDTITVRILASSTDYDQTDTGKVVRGNRDVTQWAEDWTFQRVAGATTPQAGGTMTDRCPNCGAPLELDFSGVCKYCKALVSTGTYDWVLARIARVPPAY